MRASAVCVVMALVALGAGCESHSHAWKGDRAFDNGDYVEAIWEYTKALEKRENADAAFKRACAYAIMGDGDASREDLRLAAAGGSVQARALLSVDTDSPDVDAACELVRRDTDSAWRWALYGECLLKTARWSEAADAFDKALDRDPDEGIAARARLHRTVALLAMRRYGEAAQTFSTLTASVDRPLSHEESFVGGLVAYSQGDHAAAEAYWRGLPPSLRRRLRQTLGDESDRYARLR